MNKIIDPSVIIPLSHYEELKELLNSALTNTWISTNLKLPTEGEDVLLLIDYQWDNMPHIFYYVGRLVCFKNGKKYFSARCKFTLQEVKYWMPIPGAPK